MTGTSHTIRNLAFVVAALTFVGAAAVLSGSLDSTPFASAALGPEWECTRAVLLWTSCSRVHRAEPAVQSAPQAIQSARKDAPCPRPGLNG